MSKKPNCFEIFVAKVETETHSLILDKDYEPWESDKIDEVVRLLLKHPALDSFLKIAQTSTDASSFIFDWISTKTDIIFDKSKKVEMVMQELIASLDVDTLQLCYKSTFGLGDESEFSNFDKAILSGKLLVLVK